MRASAAFFILASMAIAVPLNTNQVDHTVASVDTPKDIHNKCDPKNPQCKFQNGVVFHGVNEFEGHLGKQAGIAGNTAGKALEIEGQKDLGKSVSNNGKTAQHDLQGRVFQNDHHDHHDKHNGEILNAKVDLDGTLLSEVDGLSHHDGHHKQHSRHQDKSADKGHNGGYGKGHKDHKLDAAHADVDLSVGHKGKHHGDAKHGHHARHPEPKDASHHKDQHSPLVDADLDVGLIGGHHGEGKKHGLYARAEPGGHSSGHGNDHQGELIHGVHGLDDHHGNGKKQGHHARSSQPGHPSAHNNGYNAKLADADVDIHVLDGQHHDGKKHGLHARYAEPTNRGHSNGHGQNHQGELADIDVNPHLLDGHHGSDKKHALHARFGQGHRGDVIDIDAHVEVPERHGEGRKHGHHARHSELNKDIKEFGKEDYPEKQISKGGKAIEQQTHVVQTGGDGAEKSGKEADRQFQVISQGCKYHCDEAADAIVS